MTVMVIISLSIREQQVKSRIIPISINSIDIISLSISKTTNQISINIDINKLY